MLERVGELVIVERFQYQGLLWRPLDLLTLAVPSELWTHNPLKRAPCHCLEGYVSQGVRRRADDARRPSPHVAGRHLIGVLRHWHGPP